MCYFSKPKSLAGNYTTHSSPFYRASKYPNDSDDGRTWTLAVAAYIACWALWVLGVLIAYELIYSFIRRWRISEFISGNILWATSDLIRSIKNDLSWNTYIFPRLRSTMSPFHLTRNFAFFNISVIPLSSTPIGKMAWWRRFGFIRKICPLSPYSYHVLGSL